MPIYKQTTELTKIADFLTATEHDITEVYFGDKQVFSVWGEYDGTLPAQYSANGSMLANYRIYGAAGGVGDKTVNLFNQNTVTERALINDTTGEVNSYLYYDTSATIDIETDFILSFETNKNLNAPVRIGFYDEQGSYLGFVDTLNPTSPYAVTILTGTKKIRISFSNGGYSATAKMINIFVGSTAPVAYVPYGYVIPISVSDGTTSTTTPVYIGSDSLGEDEYVDYGEQKVYRRTKNLVGIFESVETNGIKFKFDGARVYISGTASATIPANNQIFMAFNIALKSGTYNLQRYYNQSILGWGGDVLYNKNSMRILSTPFTLSEDTEVFFGFYIVAGKVLDFSIGFVILPESEGAIAEYIPYYDPQDPPVPLPELPTVDGTTTITDYAGQSVAVPSRFVAKFRKEGY